MSPVLYQTEMMFLMPVSQRIIQHETFCKPQNCSLSAMLHSESEKGNTYND